MNKILKIQLRPKQNFYFGGEKNFSFGENGTNYLVQSTYFPQQTGLLGMLRYQLLLQNGMLPLHAHRAKAAEVIGPESFSADNSSINEFGAIQRLSPISLVKKSRQQDDSWIDEIFYQNQQVYYSQKTSGKQTLEFAEIDALPTNATAYFDCPARQINPILAPWKAKNNFIEMLVSKDDVNNRYLFEGETDNALPIKNGVFYPDWRVGISKKDKNEAFYKQKYFQLYSKFEEKWVFEFYVDLADNVKLENNEIQLGGEGGLFDMEVTDMTSKNNPLSKPTAFYGNLFHDGPRAMDKIVLLSDARINQNLFNDASLVISQTKEFRNFRTKVKLTNNFAAMDMQKVKKFEQPQRGEKYMLLARGSVIFSEKAELISQNLIQNFAHFYKIGYNHHLIVPKN